MVVIFAGRACYSWAFAGSFGCVSFMDGYIFSAFFSPAVSHRFLQDVPAGHPYICVACSYGRIADKIGNEI